MRSFMTSFPRFFVLDMYNTCTYFSISPVSIHAPQVNMQIQYLARVSIPYNAPALF